MSTLTTFIQYSFESPHRGDQRRERNSRNSNWKRIQTSIVGDIYIENPKDAIRELLELINEFNKVAGYIVNTQKSLAFLCTNNERS